MPQQDIMSEFFSLTSSISTFSSNAPRTDEGGLSPLEQALNASWEEYRETHGKATGILRSISALISMIASCTLIWMIFRSHVGLSTTQHRILMGLCIADIIVSLSVSHFNAMAPTDDSYMVWNARGNMTTCTVQGFLQFTGSVSAYFYNSSLTLYFLAVVKYGKSDKYIRTKIEPFLHAVPIIMGLGWGICALLKKHYNDNGGGGCYMPVYDPPHCQGYEDGEIPNGFEIPCGRGRDGLEFAFYVIFAVYFLPPIIICYCLIGVYRAVSKQELKLAKYGVGALRTNVTNSLGAHGTESEARNTSPPTLWSSIKNPFGFAISLRSRKSSNRPQSRSNNTRSQSRAVMYKAVAYSLAYFPLFTFNTFGFICTLTGKEWPNAVWYLSCIFAPLQGLYNLLIYIYPKVISAKRSRRGNLSWCGAFMKALSSRGKKATKGSRPRHRGNRTKRGAKRNKKRLGFSIEEEKIEILPHESKHTSRSSLSTVSRCHSQRTNSSTIASNALSEMKNDPVVNKDLTSSYENE